MKSELNFYSNDAGFNNDSKVEQVGGNNDNLESDKTDGNIVRKYRKRCLEHQKRIEELEKENKSLKQKIKELMD
jgi:hypothetical protein